MSDGVRLLPCAHKGCPWRGEDPHACPLHESEEAWERQPMLIPEHIVARRNTRYRAG